jgi:cytochrome c oxidase cbb3-type subunit 4
MTYDQVAQFVTQWGSVYFVLMFAVVLVYALWPKNKDKFAKAARTALDTEDRP